MSVENVFRVAAVSVFVMFFAVLIFFREPRRSDEVQTASLGAVAKNFGTVLGNPRFMLFLLIFSGYWIVYWQEFIILPLYVHDYINANSRYRAHADHRAIACDRIDGAAECGHAKSRSVSRHHARHARLCSGVDLSDHSSQVVMAYVTLGVVALGEIIQSPRYYEYISRLAPPGQQGTYMGFAFLAHRHRLTHRRPVRRKADPSLR